MAALALRLLQVERSGRRVLFEMTKESAGSAAQQQQDALAEITAQSFQSLLTNPMFTCPNPQMAARSLQRPSSDRTTRQSKNVVGMWPATETPRLRRSNRARHIPLQTGKSPSLITSTVEATNVMSPQPVDSFRTMSRQLSARSRLSRSHTTQQPVPQSLANVMLVVGHSETKLPASQRNL